MASDLLFEIGCEEIPAKMLARAIAELPALIEARLQTARLARGSVHAYGTPRRLAVVVRGLADRQPDLREEVTGPPVSAAFAPDGALTKAGQGFAAKNGVAESALDKREVAGKKGLYVVATRNVVGEPTRTLLPAILRELAGAIPWPKVMRWGWSETTFVRPVQWLVALFGGEVVALDWAGHTAGRKTRGHRFLSSGWIDIASADRYVETLREAHVVVDPAERRDAIGQELARIERETGLRVRPDPALLDEVTNLGEWPVAVAGEFDPSFLEVPEEIIVTAMRNHQRYFALEDAAGVLANRFVTLTATIVKDPRVVQRGNQTVIAARLSDAKFFFAEDRKHTFAEWNTKLDGVVFQAKLGDGAKTIGDKVRRLAGLVKRLGGSATAIRAAELCKADLASSAVGEFPELQGVMGKHYARLAGEPAAVADAIEQHWWPKGQGAALPTTDDAALVALADRVDTLVGCFATGLVPTGSADPLGLRRAAVGVLAILLHRPQLKLETSSLVDTAASGYATLRLSDDARKLLAEFFAARLRAILVDERGLEAQAVDCALGMHASNPSDVAKRAELLQSLPSATKVAFKRIGNILDEAAAKKYAAGTVDEAKLVATAERELWAAWRSKQDAVHTSIDTHEYAVAIKSLAELNPQLSAFFDKGGVMVMDPDPALRANRLGMLDAIYSPYKAIGDFRKLGGAA